MSLSKLDWTNWEKPGIEAGQAFVSQQKPNHETCVSHAIGKGIFEFLLKEIRLYRGYTETELKAKQEEIIDNVISKVGKITPINPVEELHGKDITQDGRKLWTEITWARRNGSTKPFADAEQRKSFLKDGSNFLIIICDTSFFQPGSDGLHAVYVDKYDERSFFCINSWDPKHTPALRSRILISRSNLSMPLVFISWTTRITSWMMWTLEHLPNPLHQQVFIPSDDYNMMSRRR